MDYNTGLRGVLLDVRHYGRMGAAIWLYAWLLLRQTHQRGTTGWVLGGAPVSYREIEEETGFNRRTLERWMRTLRLEGYIETDSAPEGVVVRIMKAKKFREGVRRAVEGVRRPAEGAAQSCVAYPHEAPSNPHLTGRIGSSSVAGSEERTKDIEFHRDFHNQSQNQDWQKQTPKPSGLGQDRNQQPNAEASFSYGPHLNSKEKGLIETRIRQQLLRAERDEAVRRELAVGTGPEIQRS
ncbi:MAG TPA: hypothetical protein VN822_04285 [Candidatus Acidoferrales bacterium]|nr:hypothetical protein [Candidatus Acidoferrales bacterium]